MKKILMITGLMLAFSIFGYAQDDMVNKPQPTEADKTAVIPTDVFLKRGAPIGASAKVSISKALAQPSQYADKTALIEGVVVRSCKMEGCWAELADSKEGKSVRVKMKGHAFFIPLQSAGAWARAEGVFVVKTMSKEQVDHMIAEDGAKFDSRNTDGTVTEVSFEATGIELKRATK
jgi:hypothetical protein